MATRKTVKLKMPAPKDRPAPAPQPPQTPPIAPAPPARQADLAAARAAISGAIAELAAMGTLEPHMDHLHRFAAGDDRVPGHMVRASLERALSAPARHASLAALGQALAAIAALERP